jgi:hypothetical protein
MKLAPCGPEIIGYLLRLHLFWDPAVDLGGGSSVVDHMPAGSSGNETL